MIRLWVIPMFGWYVGKLACANAVLWLQSSEFTSEDIRCQDSWCILSFDIGLLHFGLLRSFRGRSWGVLSASQWWLAIYSIHYQDSSFISCPMTTAFAWFVVWSAIVFVFDGNNIHTCERCGRLPDSVCGVWGAVGLLSLWRGAATSVCRVSHEFRSGTDGGWRDFSRPQVAQGRRRKTAAVKNMRINFVHK